MNWQPSREVVLHTLSSNPCLLLIPVMIYCCRNLAKMEVVQCMALYTCLDQISYPIEPFPVLIPYLLVQVSSQDGAGV